eukprot:7380261-Prymnesium_polylepis.1
MLRHALQRDMPTVRVEVWRVLEQHLQLGAIIARPPVNRNHASRLGPPSAGRRLRIGPKATQQHEVVLAGDALPRAEAEDAWRRAVVDAHPAHLLVIDALALEQHRRDHEVLDKVEQVAAEHGWRKVALGVDEFEPDRAVW